jgi:DNA-binding IclR family transcriptional regulator
MSSPENPHTGSISSSQTLLRGLDVLEAVASGTSTLKGLSAHLSLSKSTVYRLATALVSRSYLVVATRGEYRLGPQTAWLQGVRERPTTPKALNN